MTTSWAISNNADDDDDFFSTIDNFESIWNNGNKVEPTNPTVTTNSNSNSNRNSNISTVFDTQAAGSGKNGFDTQAAGSGDNHDMENDCNSSLSRSIIENQGNNSKNNSNKEDSNNYQNDTETIDVLLAQELNALSFQQHESINEEIHGINVDQIYLDSGKEIEERPELLKESFKKLQIELNGLQTDSFAYDRCQQLYGKSDSDGDTAAATTTTNTDIGKKTTTTHINTSEFRIMFLRCELFDVAKAARRLINFVELMYELYGDLGLQRRIRVEDLSDHEKSILNTGSFGQILPGRDRAGRRVLVSIPHNNTNLFPIKSRLRLVFYSQMSLADDIETQRKGCVLLQWWQNVNIFNDLSKRSKTNSVFQKCAPVRFGGIHICIPEILEDNNFMNIPLLLSSDDDSADSTVTKTSSLRSATPVNVIKSMIALSIGKKARSQLRLHTGSVMECLYALQSFGIPSNQMPLVNGITSNKKRRKKNKTKRNDTVVGDDDNYNGILKLNNHYKWLELCQLKENNMKSYSTEWKCYGKNSHGGIVGHQIVIECPKHSDILSGRGKDIMNHPGNSVLRSIVASKLDEYNNSNSYTETTKLTLDVVHLLKNKYGARFLKEETIESNGKLGCWIEVPDEQARLKVRIAFRDKIKVQQPQQSDKPKQSQQQQTELLMSPQMMMMATTDNNDDRQIQQGHQRRDEENTDSSSKSMFLSMAGSSSGGASCSSCSTSTGKKRPLQTKGCFGRLD